VLQRRRILDGGENVAPRPNTPDGDIYSSSSAARTAAKTLAIGRRTAITVARPTFSRATLASIAGANGEEPCSSEVTSEY